MGRNSPTLFCKVLVPLYQFSHNAQLFNKIVWTFLYRVFPKLHRKCTGKKITLPFKIKYDFHCTDFYETNFCSTRICEDFRYRISLISAKKCEMRLSVGLGAAVYIDCYKTDFQGTPPYSATFCKELLNQNL